MADLQASPISDRNGALEEAFVDDYLRTQGHTREGVQCLPPEIAKRILTEATRAADSRLAEIESRARRVHGIHHESLPVAQK